MFEHQRSNIIGGLNKGIGYCRVNNPSTQERVIYYG